MSSIVCAFWGGTLVDLSAHPAPAITASRMESVVVVLVMAFVLLVGSEAERGGGFEAQRALLARRAVEVAQLQVTRLREPEPDRAVDVARECVGAARVEVDTVVVGLRRRAAERLGRARALVERAVGLQREARLEPLAAEDRHVLSGQVGP